MTAGDADVLITVTSGGFIMTGGTVSLVVKKPNSAEASASYGMSVQPGGLSATYTTTGTEFPVGGIYQVQLQYLNAGAKYASKVQTIVVVPQLV